MIALGSLNLNSRLPGFRMNRQPCGGFDVTRACGFVSFAARALILTIAVLAILTGPAEAVTANPIVINGDLTQGTGSIPTAWQSHAWIPDGSTFSWEQAAGAGELRVVSAKANDAYWIQHLELAAGWYHFSAQLRTSQVGAQNTGASLSLLQDWVSSEELHGTQDWQTVEFYLKVGADGASVDLACRLRRLWQSQQGRSCLPRNSSNRGRCAPSRRFSSIRPRRGQCSEYSAVTKLQYRLYRAGFGQPRAVSGHCLAGTPLARAQSSAG